MKIFVAIPGYDGKLLMQFAQCLLLEQSIALRFGDDISINFVSGNAGIIQARNQLVTEFLASDCDRLVFLDADVTCEPGDLAKLAHHPADVVGGCYRYKRDGEAYPMRFLPGERWTNKDGLMEVESLPTGFLAISRSVFEAMIKDKPQQAQIQGGHKAYCLFQMPVVDGHLYGEDFYFCREWRAMGGKVYLDPELNLTHWGTSPTPFVGHVGNWLRTRENIPIPSTTKEVVNG